MIREDHFDCFQLSWVLANKSSHIVFLCVLLMQRTYSIDIHDDIHIDCSVFGNEPEFTVALPRWIGTVDYIFYGGPVIVRGVATAPPAASIQQVGGYPSSVWSSDHIASVAEFCLVSDSG